MSSNIQDSKSFSFDGKNINFYRSSINGGLRIVDNQFEELGEDSPNVSENDIFSIEHSNVADTAFKIFFDAIEPDHQKFLEEKLRQNNLANFRRTPNESGDEQFYVDLTIGLQQIRVGMIVALGGFYALPDEPISCDLTKNAVSLTSTELEKRFLAAFETLKTDKWKEAPEIIKQIGWEGNTIHGLIKRKAQPSIIMGASKGKKITWANLISRSLGWKKHIPGGFFIARYVQAATMNFDHFGAEAESTYAVGHRLALQMAAKASALPDKDNTKWEKFVEALTMELFACHFFADLFVSGHVRTPRRKIFEVINKGYTVKKKWIAALFANQMHDADNEQGVYVCSKSNPTPWEAMGDYRYSDDNASNEGEVHAQRALAARLSELYQVFRKKADWHATASRFKEDVPQEATPKWLNYCQCNDTKAYARAMEHAKKFPPLFRVGNNGQLEAGPDYQTITKKEMVLLLADLLAKGLIENVKEIADGTVKEITRITSLSSINSKATTKTTQPNKQNLTEPMSSYEEFADDPLRKEILKEIFMLDDADEVIVGIEMPQQDAIIPTMRNKKSC